MKRKLLIVAIALFILFSSLPAFCAESIKVKDFLGNVHSLSYKSINSKSGVLLIDSGPNYFYFKDKLNFIQELNNSIKSNAKSEADLELLATEIIVLDNYFLKYELLRGVNRTHLYMYRIFTNDVADEVYLQLTKGDVINLIRIMIK
jgi:hypothetical protein